MLVAVVPSQALYLRGTDGDGKRLPGEDAICPMPAPSKMRRGTWTGQNPRSPLLLLARHLFFAQADTHVQTLYRLSWDCVSAVHPSQLRHRAMHI